MQKDTPILYSFRRCPYAMRARLALYTAGIAVELREVVLRDKPAALIELSPKGTVPVLQLLSGHVLEESLDIMRFAFHQHDPLGYGMGQDSLSQQWIKDVTDFFIPHLNRYKYAARYADAPDPLDHRAEACRFLDQMEQAINAQAGGLLAPQDRFVDLVIFPFIRQFSLVEPNWFASQPWPQLHQWLSTKLNSPAFAAIMKKYPQWQDGDTPVKLDRG